MGNERGVQASGSNTGYAVSGIAVDTAGKDSDEARLNGWRQAQRLGWKQLWERLHHSPAPALSDAQLDAIVGGINVEQESFSAHRYIARLGVVFDRVRAATALGSSGSAQRSAPYLVIPIIESGGVARVFESRTEWQKAWARFNPNSAINYIRPTGDGAAPLLLNAAQIGRRNRTWWRSLLDLYSAADVLEPKVTLEHLWPGGPVNGHFSAYYGPDNHLLERFDLRAESPADIAKMMDSGVARMDAIYAQAFASGKLKPDQSLVIETPVVTAPAPEKPLDTKPGNTESPQAVAPASSAPAATSYYKVHARTPDAASLAAVLQEIRGTKGVITASPNSVAIGGTSVFSLGYAGDMQALSAALSARGVRVEHISALRTSR